MSPSLDRITDAYACMAHTPHARDVWRAYSMLSSELWQQFARLPMHVTFTDTDPYATSHEMHTACDRGHLAVYRGADLPDAHPLSFLAPNGETFNSIFRAVHDGMAHRFGRYGFGVEGELCAFRVHWHSLLLTPPAQHALATETLGQTAVYARTKTFAAQKAGLLPLSLILPFTEDSH